MADPAPAEPRDALQGWLTLLPAAALAAPAPLALVRDVPTPVSAASGWTALLAVPAVAGLVAGLVAGRRVLPRGAVPLLALLAVAALGAGSAGDPFAARRTLTGLAAGAALLVSGASLGAAGRRVLARGLALLSVAWLAWAATDAEAGFTGAVGNTGDLSEAVVPGAVTGLAVFAATSGPLRVAGLVAGAGAALYAGLVPVLAGLASLFAAGLVAAAAGVGRPATARTARLVLLATLAGALAFGARSALRSAGATGGPESGEADGVAAAAADDLGGVEFRRRTWACVPAMLAGRALLGVGPGQFEREYPPFRDPLERRLSSHGGREPTPVEVEHAHSDWIEGVAELGILGGAAWLALLACVLGRAWVGLRSGDSTRAALGAAAVAVLANALASSPLLHGVASPAVAWPLFGAVLGSREPAGAARRRAGLLLPIFAALLVASRAPAAWRFTRHGEALAGIARTTIVSESGREGLVAREVAPLVAAALEACPDSVVALEKRDQLLRASGAPPEERVATLERILDAQPHRFGPLLNLGAVLADDGRLREARTAFARAQAVAPDEPALLKNRLLLAIEMDERDVLLELVAELSANDAIDAAWLERTAAAQLLAGRPGIGAALVAILDPSFDASRPETSFELSRELERQGRELFAAGAAANAHLLWGREHVAAGSYETAVRSYRQALRLAREYPDLPGGAALVKLELAAAELLAERPDDARETVAGVEATAVEKRSLPEWAGQALMEAGLLR